MIQDSTILIRAVRPDDAPALAAIRNMPNVRHGTLALPFSRVEETQSHIAKLGPDNHLLVAECGGEVVGSAGLNRYSGRRSHVGGVGIAIGDPWQEQGVGKALMTAIVDLADNWRGLRRIELNVYSDNERAIALYKRFSFYCEGTMRNYCMRDGRLIDSLLMARLVEISSEVP